MWQLQTVNRGYRVQRCQPAARDSLRAVRMMNAQYLVHDTGAIYTPALIFYKDFIRRNIQHAIAVAGDVDRLRPHVKTHKTREVVRMELDAGIRNHKCATIAEAEMLA